MINICSVSGGKDSTALYLWCIDNFGKDGFLAVFADTGNEHPVTLNYVRNMHLMANGPAVNWVTADFTEFLEKRGKEASGNPFLDLCVSKGRVPSSRAQFCTENVKMAPIRKWLDKFRNGEEVTMFTGIRRGESLKRSKYEKEEYLAYYDCKTVRPLIDWTEAQVFAFIKSKGLEPNPLYSAGFSRVGCFPCIHARKSELSLLPEWAWEKLTEWETKIGRSWFSYGTLPLTDTQKLEFSKLPKVQITDEMGNNVTVTEPLAEEEFKNKNSPTVAQAKEWAKTTRGGVQFNMFAPDESDVPGCMSTWGICE